LGPRDWLGFLGDIAEAADELALARFRAGDLHVEEKPDLGPVTEADLAIEARAREIVRQRQPGLGVYGEEEGETGIRGATRLIIDPIDSTRNFVRGIPVFATLLAIEEGGEIVAGLVSAPALATRWSAARGLGAWSGSRRLRVSGIRDLASAQVFHGSIAGNEAEKRVPGQLRLLEASERQRGFGDFYQHVLVAEGCGELALDPIVSPWDIAPLQVIVEEAGGRATSLSGERSIYAGSLVSTNGHLHPVALGILSPAT
jgi:histidinol-phosphatase